MRAGPNQEEIRRHNLGALLRHVHIHGPTSRAELTTAMGLNRSTIGALTADLAEAGLISEEVPRDHGRAGRPSLVVSPESVNVYAYAVTIGVDRVACARVGLGGVVLDRREVVRPGRGFTPSEALEPLAEFIAQMRRSTPAAATCVGAGAAISAMVRHSDGLVRFGPNIGWVNEPLGEALTGLLGEGSAVQVANNADVSALAEHIRGAAVGCDDLVYLHGDVGIGAGLIAGGRPVTGHGGYGGEVGHMVVNPRGLPCACGSHGCWETEIGEKALLRAAGRDEDDTVAAVVEAADRGDRAAQAALRQVGDWLGFGVANLVNILNPAMIVFGGTLRDVYLASAAQVRSRVHANGLPVCREHVKLRTPSLGEDAQLLGAAELAFAHLLTDPLR